MTTQLLHLNTRQYNLELASMMYHSPGKLTVPETIRKLPLINHQISSK